MKTNTMLMGPPGSGKSTAIKTFLELKPKRRLFLLATEPGVESIFGDTDPQYCHWKYIPPAAADWDTMQRSANDINTMPMKILMERQGNRSQYRQFIEVLESCSDFVCDRTGEHFGPIDELPEEDMFSVDSLSGLSIMAMDLVAGNKPIKTMQDWGVAMDNLERLITKFCCDTKCSFTLSAHMDRETDELTGGTKLMVSTLGKKLAPKLPRFFDEVVQSVKNGKEFVWSTVESGTDLKCRRLPLSDEIPPHFKMIFGEG